MTATNSSKPAKDGTSASFTLEVASESVSGNIAQKTYLGSPSTEALVEPPTHADVTAITTALGSPAQDGTDSTGVTQLTGGVGMRGWLSGIFSKLATVISTLNAPMQNSGGTVGISGSLPAFGATPTVNLGTLNGAATAAKQPALGTAGIASADVVTIQGAASMTPVKVDGSAVTQPVSGSVSALTSGDIIVVPTSNFTRSSTVTAYVAGQLVANNGTAAPLSWSVARVNAGNCYIRRATMFSTGKSITNTSFVLHLYTVSPTITGNDYSTFTTTLINWIGAIPITLAYVGSDVAAGSGAPSIGGEINFVCGGSTQTIYGLLVAAVAYTPVTGEVITVNLEVHQN